MGILRGRIPAVIVLAALLALGAWLNRGALADVAAEGMQHATDAAVEMAGAWLRRSRRQALRAGVQPIPAGMRAKLARYFPASLLDAVRYRVGVSTDPTLQGLALGTKRKDAITLIDVVVFRNAKDARNDELWAHELEHVCQFRRWGVEGFVRRYLKNDWAVEWKAYETEFTYERYLKGLVKHRHAPCPARHRLPAFNPKPGP